MTAPLHELKDIALTFLDLLDAGEVTVEELRERVCAELPEDQHGAVLALIQLADLLHQCPALDDPPVAAVKDPGFRKGTGMHPTTWANCPWKPPGVSP